jgi:hypothetical protein
LGCNGIKIKLTIQCQRRVKFLSGLLDLPKAQLGQLHPLKAIRHLRDLCPLSLSSLLMQVDCFLPSKEEPEVS